jgi:hypothetical protein
MIETRNLFKMTCARSIRRERRAAVRVGRAILVSALLAGSLKPGRVAASCADLIFRDGFELGDTARWSNSPDPARATGTWTFSLDFSGTTRTFALELIQRPNGAIVGYLLGGTSSRVLVGGSLSGATLTLELELSNPDTTKSVSISGVLGRNLINAVATGDLGTQPVTLERTDCELYEQLFAAALDVGGEPSHLQMLAVVHDDEGVVIAGSFVGQEDCDLWACEGGVTSVNESGDTLIVGLESDDGCSDGSSFTVDWDPSGVYLGDFSFTDCDGTTTGSMIAAFAMGTTSSDAHDLLALRASVAEALESGVPISSPIPAVSPDYLNFGKNEAGLRDELNAEIAAYEDIQVDLERARDVFTQVHPRTFPGLLVPVGVTLDERRTGTPLGGGGPMTYLDTGARPVIDDLAVVDMRPNGWRIVGNQAPALDLPFMSTVSTDGARLEAPTEDGRPVYISIGPYGAHFGPLTGDPSGEAKANFVGFMAQDDSDMEELDGDFDGVREPGEVWGYPIGGDVTGDAVRLRRPAFIAPVAGAVSHVRFEEGASPIHFDHEPQWKVEIELTGGVRYAIGHVGRIAAPLRALVLAATGLDTDTFAGPPGTDLLSGHDPIPVTAGTELALPQILAGPVPGFPGYWVGEGSFLEWPWAQIEFQVPFHIRGTDALGGDFCVYRFFSPDRRAELQGVMETDMLDSESQRYRDRLFYDRWQWTAQGGLCQAESPLPRDFSDLYTRLGGWFERPEAGTTADELFSFVPIDKSTAVYEPSNYDSAAVDHLVIRNLWPGPYSWSMPDATIAEVFLGVGEVLDRSADAMLIKWRELNPTNPVVYQRLAYRLDADGLTIKWGNFASSPGTAVQPVLVAGEPCDDTTVLCYDHSRGAWPP